MSFARIIPAIRTPFGVDAFDYKIPSHLHLEIGDIVSVPFRRATIIGLVKERMEYTTYEKQALSILASYASIRLPRICLDLLTWTADRTFTSQATVLHAWLRTLPKHPSFITAGASIGNGCASNLTSIKTFWQTSPRSALIQTARASLVRGEKILIITPWRIRAETIQHHLPTSRVLHGDIPDGAAFRLWNDFLSQKLPCLISTRIGAWLAPLADRVLLDEPENDDHKQDELAPRYDARSLLFRCAEQTGCALDVFGLTPPLHVKAQAPSITLPVLVHVRHPQGRSSIPCLQGDTVVAIQHHDGPVTIIHPIRGTRARLRCRDCGWESCCADCGGPHRAYENQIVCSICGKKSTLPIACPSCRGTDLGKATPGIDQLRSSWLKNLPDVPVTWRDITTEQLDVPFENSALVVVTDGALLGGGIEDIRRRERLVIAFRRLADATASAHGSLLIQSNESLASVWTDWLTETGYAAFVTQEQTERTLFAYPPSVRLVKALILGHQEDAHRWIEKAQQLLGHAVSIRGPFFVAHRPSSRGQRYAVHLLFQKTITDRFLINTLTPLAKSAILDLDPIAFYR